MQTTIKRKIKQLEDKYYVTISDDVLTELRTTRVVLHNLITRKAEKDILFAKQRLFEYGNKQSRLLARLARNAPRKSFISVIQDENNQRQVNYRLINDRSKRFHDKLYSSEIDIDKLKEGIFINNLNIPQLSDDQADILEGPISLFEIDTAISSLHSGKSPGLDGFPVDIFLKGKFNKIQLRGFQ